MRSFSAFAADFARASGRLGPRAALFAGAGALLEGVGLALLLPLVSLVSGSGTGSGFVDRGAARMIAAMPGQTTTTRLLLLLGLFALLMALRAYVLLRRDVLMARLQTGFVQRLRLRVVRALTDADWGALARLRHGRVSHVLSNDIRSCGLAAQLTLQSAVAIVMLSVQMTLALLLSPWVALLVFVLLGGGALALRPALRRSRELGMQLTDASFRLTDDTNQFLSGLKLAFSQNLQDGFVREFGHTLAFGASREVAFARQRALGQIALTSLAAFVAGTALFAGFALFETSAASLFALLVVLARMSGPAAQLQQNLQYIAYSLPAYEKIAALEAELAAFRGRASESGSSGPTPEVAGDLVFSGVSYTHGSRDGSSDVSAGVNDVDLVIEPGTLLGIAGPSGAGKTTLVDLLVGLLPPQVGEITAEGKPLRGAALHAWRERISYVSQDPFLFHDSIAGNLLWARPEAEDADLWRALRLAGAEGMVRALPEGLDTVVGERGSLLSGGERQRIALARALIREPLLLVLDEATNAIDVDGERAVLERLAGLRPRPTIVIVAHRDQSLALCERVITVDGGRIVADARAKVAVHG
ncbi:MAG: Lipid A export ATP-binding/permease protein MsbA [uncultured Sphingomonadaceae bacterium]|uniref:Lipid A export ATP-binding/permease protein MsbA n=1 Tax=uncultured Sphingomonadaceae bacterium TaxID=169976 RepID=A0A6J4SS00_9SPHN|nr:MAG: Lipid A export ATP-binding/permease protein MsbA [uncultured Sphingomonadaceae bacterium]